MPRDPLCITSSSLTSGRDIQESLREHSPSYFRPYPQPSQAGEKQPYHKVLQVNSNPDIPPHPSVYSGRNLRIAILQKKYGGILKSTNNPSELFATSSPMVTPVFLACNKGSAENKRTLKGGNKKQPSQNISGILSLPKANKS